MKRPSREINSFNISMLDTISGALGAVMILMLILLTQKIGVESSSLPGRQIGTDYGVG